MLPFVPLLVLTSLVTISKTSVADVDVGGVLYPQETDTRELRILDGIWNFRVSPVDSQYGITNKWFAQDLDKVIFLTIIKAKYTFLLIKKMHTVPKTRYFLILKYVTY